MTAPAAGTRPADARPPDGRSVPELVSAVAGELGDLVRREVDLAKAEVRDQLGTATRAGAMFTITGVVGLLALQVLSVAAALGLATVLPDAAAFALVGALYLAVAAVALARGRQNLSRFAPLPQQTIQTIRDDIQVARASLARGAQADPSPPAAYARPWADDHHDRS